MSKIKKAAILFSGGNAPGMNNVLICFVKKCLYEGIEPFVIYEGFKGLYNGKIEKADVRNLELFNYSGNIVTKSARFPEFKDDKFKVETIEQLKKRGIEALVVCGGDGSYNGAAGLYRLGFPTIAIPGTIDNDVSSTEYTIGFDSALNRIVEQCDAIKDSFWSHNGVAIVEVMGREFSDLALQAGAALNVDHVVTKDNIIDKAGFLKVAKQAIELRGSGLILVTESLYGRNGLDSLDQIKEYLTKELQHSLIRKIVVGYCQRGGTPTARDRYVSSLMASRSIELLKQEIFGKAISYDGKATYEIDLAIAIDMSKKKNDLKLLEDINKYNKH